MRGASFVVPRSRLLTREECEALAGRIFGLVSAPAAEVRIASEVRAATSFALADSHVASEHTTIGVSLTVELAGGKRGIVATNRVDEAGLRALVVDAEAAAGQHQAPARAWPFARPEPRPSPPKLFFDEAVPAMAPQARAALFLAAIEATEAAGLIGAGDIQLALQSSAILNTGGLFIYRRSTFGEFSLTARTKNGLGSGWAWSGFEDWTRVNPKTVVARAVDLAQRSANPVAVEPGRYTVILEPAAVAALVEQILPWWSARLADGGGTVFSREGGGNKIGLKMLDGRLGIVSDPWDPDLPADTWHPFYDRPIQGKVVWFERGVLKNLEYDPWYAEEKRKPMVIASAPVRLTAEGSTATLDEMIAATPRGIWVNRLSHVATMNARTLLLTGTTRDGTFLIENGKITKSIKNFRFNESPFFVLNKLEAAGEPVRASSSIVAPRLKVRDFDFTSLTDAV